MKSSPIIQSLIGILIYIVLCVSLVFAATAPKLPKSYEEVYSKLINLEADPGKVAEVQNLTLTRDVAIFSLQQGRLFIAKPVDERIVSVLFIGTGIFSYTPSTTIERDHLYRFYEKKALQEKFNVLFLLFADTTFDELARRVSITQGSVSSEANQHFAYCMNYISDPNGKYFHEHIIKPFLDNVTNEMFYAHFSENKVDPMFFLIDPYEEEEIRFMRRSKTDVQRHSWEVINQFHTQQDYLTGEFSRLGRKDIISIRSCVLDCRFSDDLSVSAKAEIQFQQLKSNQHWLYFYLYEKLEVDSVLWSDGSRAVFFKEKENPLLWILCDPPFESGHVIKVLIYYKGDILVKAQDYFYIRSTTGWYPRYNPLQKSTFDITFHIPDRFKFASIGEKVSSKTENGINVEQWVSPKPIRNASFNIGYFEEHKIHDDRIPPTIIYMTAQKGSMIREVGADIANSYNFFQEIIGKNSLPQLYATEIPFQHGEAFPGLVHLSILTFYSDEMKQIVGQDYEGMAEMFRAHEIAHQWWPMSVDFRTYHDQWLSEGFATFFGLWYMQTTADDKELYFKKLRKWKESIMENRKFIFGSGKESGPIWLGYRTGSSETREDFDLIIYKKGAWVLHMLRNLLIDFKTMNEDRFKNLIKDFYQTYKDSIVSTYDFQKIVQKHTNIDMTWFFKQWVYDTPIPTYKFAYKVDETPDYQYKVTCKVEQLDVAEDFQMVVPLYIDFGGGQFTRLRSIINGPVSQFDFLLPKEPKNIILNDLESVLCKVENVGWD